MGVFLCISGIAQANRADVEKALMDFVDENSGTMSQIMESDVIDEDELMILHESEKGHITIMYPTTVSWDEASEFLSAKLNKPVFSLHVHDSDFWMYILYVNGKEVDRFHPYPEYYQEDSEEELIACAGNAEIVCRHWPNLRPEQISNYLVRWYSGEDEDYDEPEEVPVKAYPDDEFFIRDDWQIADFMRKVGLDFFETEEGSPEKTRYHFRIPWRTWN